jgi:hypothetical protein
MKGAEKFLFYYSLLAITILFFTSVFFAPKPQNFISLILLIPLIIYFWIKTTSPSTTTPNFWSIRVLAVLLILSLLGIISYSLGVPKQTAQVKKGQVAVQGVNDEAIQELAAKISALDKDGSSEEIAKELADIKEQLARITGKTSTSSTTGGTGGVTLGENFSSDDVSELIKNIPYGLVKISNQNVTELDVLAEAAFSSRRMGSMQSGQNYEFFEKKDGWYLVKLTDGTLGWVNERDVQEVNQ